MSNRHTKTSPSRYTDMYPHASARDTHLYTLIYKRMSNRHTKTCPYRYTDMYPHASARDTHLYTLICKQMSNRHTKTCPSRYTNMYPHASARDTHLYTYVSSNIRNSRLHPLATFALQQFEPNHRLCNGRHRRFARAVARVAIKSFR